MQAARIYAVPDGASARQSEKLEKKVAGSIQRDYCMVARQLGKLPDGASARQSSLQEYMQSTEWRVSTAIGKIGKKKRPVARPTTLSLARRTRRARTTDRGRNRTGNRRRGQAVQQRQASTCEQQRRARR